MNNIISKVHIVIPALKYDHEYTTHIELESVIPTIEDPEPTTPQEQPKQNDTTQDQQPATDKTESSTPEKPSTSVSNTETQNKIQKLTHSLSKMKHLKINNLLLIRLKVLLLKTYNFSEQY